LWVWPGPDGRTVIAPRPVAQKGARPMTVPAAQSPSALARPDFDWDDEED